MGERLGEMLVRKGLLAPDKLEAALMEQARTGKFLGGLTVKGGEPAGFPIIAPRDQTRIAGPIVDHAQFVEALPGYLKSDAPQTGGPTGESSSMLTWLLVAAGLVIVSGGAWAVSRARREI